MKKRVLSLLLALILLGTLGLTVLAAVEDTGFSDVAAGAWYADAVEYVRDNGLMSGTSVNSFSPNTTTSRAMLVTILYRRAGSPNPGAAGFSDVAADAWYGRAAGWAAGEGIVNSTSRTAQEQNDPASRPALGGENLNLADYDRIYLGYPIWFGQAPKIISTFLERYDFTGKTIIPFCTSGSSAIGSSGDLLHRLASGATWLEGRRFDQGASASVITGWADSLRQDTPTTDLVPQPTPDQEEDAAMLRLTIEVGGSTFPITLEDNDTTRAFVARLPMTVNMGELNGNEKYYYLPTGLPTNPQRPGTIHTGDLMLYGSDCLVLFYETFSSGYRYTRMGRVDDPSGLTAALGQGGVVVRYEVR